MFRIPFLAAALLLAPAPVWGQALERLKYNHPGLVVDLGVGLWAWPLPIDFDGDGHLDLVVNCPDKPSNGVYVFETPAARFPCSSRAVASVVACRTSR
jgi:hypothetical protein